MRKMLFGCVACCAPPLPTRCACVLAYLLRVTGCTEDEMTIIKIDLDKKCKKCGELGATQNGYCLKCLAKMINGGEFDNIIDRVTAK